ncbi:MAG: hypothetical protein AAB618_01615 [Patescibacteria group bacterium]
MTHVSRKQIDSIDYSEAQKQLTELITKLNSSSATHFINELFTEAERIMLIKRFAAIFMFQQEYSYYRVSQAVGISTSTSRLIYEKYLVCHYDKLLASIPKNQKSEFLALVEDFLLSKASYKARQRLLKRVL